MDTATKIYTRLDVQLLGDYPTSDTFATCKRYQVGDKYFVVSRILKNAAQNAALKSYGMDGYGDSYPETTIIRIFETDQHADPASWDYVGELATESDDHAFDTLLLPRANHETSFGRIVKTFEDQGVPAVEIESEELVVAEPGEEVEEESGDVAEGPATTIDQEPDETE